MTPRPGRFGALEIMTHGQGFCMQSNDAAMRHQISIMIEASAIYGERNTLYKDNWKRFGWRGCLFRLRERVERAWDVLWDADPDTLDEEDETRDRHPVVDDLYDLINFAAFTIRAIEEGNRDGTWFQQPTN